MPIVFPTPTSPPPQESTMSMQAPSPPPPARMAHKSSSSSLAQGIAQSSAAGSSTVSHQVGTRQATRSRTRTRQAHHQQAAAANVNGSSIASSSRLPMTRYNSEDHPLSAHKLAARGYHSFHCLGVPFHVKKRYTFLRELGIGAYGCVALAHDSLLDCNVAIKKVTRIFEREVLARRALREVAVLRDIGLCDNVTALLDFDSTFIEFNEIYLVLEASEADLSQIIRSGQALSDAHLQYFIAQILRGVRYMHTARIIHRDMKPGNLLVNGDCQLKLCDFGLARAFRDRAADTTSSASTNTDSPSAERSFPDSPHIDRSQPASPSMQISEPAKPGQLRTTALDFPGGPLTEYVATRWYRAPEIMLCFKRGYGPAIDMWSVGCILAELLGGKPIFAGKDYVDQIARINNLLGSPSKSTIDKVGSERARTYVESLPHMPAVPFSQLYPKANPLAIDLLEKMLCWDPEDRITAAEALSHPWLKAYHRSNANWTPPQPFDRFDEVEMLSSIADFREGLERESDEMRAELEALEAEEMQAAQIAAQAQPDSNDDSNEHSRGRTNGNDVAQDPEETTTAVGNEFPSSRQGEGNPPAFLTSARSTHSRGMTSPSAGSINLTPSPLSSSVNEISPTYETDLTSVSAPHSVAGSHSAGKRSRNRAVDGLGLLSNTFEARNGKGGEVRDRGREALDKRLAVHGLLRGDDMSRLDNDRKPSFRRRALSNAPSQETRVRRHGSDGSLRQRAHDAVSLITCSVSSSVPGESILGSLSSNSGQSTVRTATVREDGVEVDDDDVTRMQASGGAKAVDRAMNSRMKSTDIIRRSALQREQHDAVADEAAGLLTWLWKSSSPWTARPSWFGLGAASKASDESSPV